MAREKKHLKETIENISRNRKETDGRDDRMVKKEKIDLKKCRISGI